MTKEVGPEITTEVTFGAGVVGGVLAPHAGNMTAASKSKAPRLVPIVTSVAMLTPVKCINSIVRAGGEATIYGKGIGDR